MPTIMDRLSEEERAFLQRRVGIFGGVAGGTALAFWLFRLVAIPDQWQHPFDPSMRWHLVASLLLGPGAGVLAHPGERSCGPGRGARRVRGRTGRAGDHGDDAAAVRYVAFVYLVNLDIDLEAWSRLDPVVYGGTTARAVASSRAAYFAAQWCFAAAIMVLASRVLYGLRRDVRDARQLGQYRLVRKLGEGGMGAVYQARHATLRRPTADARSDLYALGAVAYHLVTGQHVFTGATVIEICSEHLHSPPIPMSERLGRPVEPALDALILQCLEKSAGARPANAEAVVAALQALDLPPWRPRDARAWWEEYGPALEHHRAATHAPASLAVDIGRLRSE